MCYHRKYDVLKKEPVIVERLDWHTKKTIKHHEELWTARCKKCGETFTMEVGYL